MQYQGKIEISISDPVMVTTSSGSFVTYKVFGVDQKGVFQKRRRYRDFFLLRQKLVERWPGLYVPPISSKKATGNTQQRFVCFRAKFLDYFCNKIAERDHFFYSEPFQSFIRGQQDFEVAIKILPVIQYENLLTIYEKNFTELTEKISESELQLSTETDYLFLKASEKRLEKLRDNYRKIVEIKTEYDNQYNTVIEKALGGYEQKFLLNYVEEDRSKLFLKSNEEFFEKFQVYKKYTKNKILEEYIEKISYEIRQMRAFKEGIEARKKIQQLRNKTQKEEKERKQEIQKLKNGKTTFKSIFSTGSKEELLKKNQDEAQKLEKLKAVLYSIIFLINASIYTDMKNYKQNRLQKYREGIKEMNKKQIKQMAVYGDMLKVVLCDNNSEHKLKEENQPEQVNSE